jgi:hypothetical protein
MALIGGGGAAEAVAEHPVAGLQGGLDALLHVLGPIGRVEQQFGGAAGGRLAGRVQQQLPQGLAQGGAAGLAGGDHLRPGRQQAAGRQPGRQRLELAGLAAAIDAFQHHEAAALTP